MKKRIIVLLCLVMILLVGCGESSSLNGKWINTEASATDSFVFFSDGTGTLSDDSTSFAITWMAENGRLKISVDTGLLGEVSNSYNYKLTKDTLVLTDDEGESGTYTRVTESE